MTSSVSATIGGSASLSQVLAKLMKLNNLNGSELAELIGLPSQTINRILSGFVKDPRASTLTQVADYFGITIDQLLGKKPLPQEFSLIASEVSQPPVLIPLHTVKSVMTAGEPFSSGDWFCWPNQGLSTTKDHFALKITGLEFEPTFSNGTILVIDPNLPCQTGDFILVKFQTNEQPTIKKVLLNQPEDYFLPLREGLKVISFKEIPNQILGIIIEAHIDLRKTT